MIKKIIYIMGIICLILLIIMVHKTYAKYVLNDDLQLDIYIDKTPPVINITGNNTDESYNQSKTELIKKSEDLTLNTSDNIQISYNEYYYNSSENNFDGKTPTRFENGQDLTDEGYYKIIAVDTSGNRTEIIVLIDKTPPNVTVRFYKKGRISLINENYIANGGVA